MDTGYKEPARVTIARYSTPRNEREADRGLVSEREAREAMLMVWLVVGILTAIVAFLASVVWAITVLSSVTAVQAIAALIIFAFVVIVGIFLSGY